jgi:hypothetical protein
MFGIRKIWIFGTIIEINGVRVIIVPLPYKGSSSGKFGITIYCIEIDLK